MIGGESAGPEVRRQVKLGLVGFGEVGSALASGLSKQGLTSISAFDPKALSGPFSGLLRKRAIEAQADLVNTWSDLARRSTLILGVVPGSASRGVAQSLRAVLNDQHVYVDLAAATPNVKQAVASILSKTGAQLADGAIMSTPREDGYRILILASGPAARTFSDLMTPWGMRVSTVDADIGAASGIKSLRTVFTKGIEALLVECVLACHRYGIEQEVLGSIAQWMDQRPFLETVNLLLVTDAIHAGRRASEVSMSARALRQVGIEPTMTNAAGKVLRRVAGLGLEEEFGGVIPERYAEVINVLNARLKDAASKGVA
jgi:3-hydroxyisobutyrate dehydrogenase-like beta-hydroxyacid dehydrogenase